jgi:hypothetical protein
MHLDVWCWQLGQLRCGNTRADRTCNFYRDPLSLCFSKAITELHCFFKLKQAPVLRERSYLGDLGLGGKMVLKWIFQQRDGEAWTGFIWLRIGTGGWRL